MVAEVDAVLGAGAAAFGLAGGRCLGLPRLVWADTFVPVAKISSKRNKARLTSEPPLLISGHGFRHGPTLFRPPCYFPATGIAELLKH